MNPTGWEKFIAWFSKVRDEAVFQTKKSHSGAYASFANVFKTEYLLNSLIWSDPSNF